MGVKVIREPAAQLGDPAKFGQEIAQFRFRKVRTRHTLFASILASVQGSLQGSNVRCAMYVVTIIISMISKNVNEDLHVWKTTCFTCLEM